MKNVIDSWQRYTINNVQEQEPEKANAHIVEVIKKSIEKAGIAQALGRVVINTREIWDAIPTHMQPKSMAEKNNVLDIISAELVKDHRVRLHKGESFLEIQLNTSV